MSVLVAFFSFYKDLRLLNGSEADAYFAQCTGIIEKEVGTYGEPLHTEAYVYIPESSNSSVSFNLRSAVIENATKVTTVWRTIHVDLYL
jgi:hypothetical protein